MICKNAPIHIPFPKERETTLPPYLDEMEEKLNFPIFPPLSPPLIIYTIYIHITYLPFVGGQVQQYHDVPGEAVQYFPRHGGPSSKECDDQM